MCPNCTEEAYVVDENRCAACGEALSRTCSFCENEIPVSELDDDGLCGLCRALKGSPHETEIKYAKLKTSSSLSLSIVRP
jgi:hypothetical protein